MSYIVDLTRFVCVCVFTACVTLLAAVYCNQMLDGVINVGAEGACFWPFELGSHIALIICFPPLECGVVLHECNPQPTSKPPPTFSSSFVQPLISLYFAVSPTPTPYPLFRCAFILSLSPYTFFSHINTNSSLFFFPTIFFYCNVFRISNYNTYYMKILHTLNKK